MYKVGMIGYGWASTAHIGAINGTGKAEVTAVFSRRELEDAEVSAAHGGTITTYTDIDAMLASDVDAVSICTYPHEHKEFAVKAAKAGKHLIIEKPLALNWEDCEAIAAAVEEAGVKTCVCFECRFSSQFLATKAVIDEGLIGDLHYGEIDYYHGVGPWYGQFRWNVKKDAGGSSLLSAGCHALDALLLCMGEDVVEVTSYPTKSRSEIFEPYEYDTTTVTILKFASGRVGKVASVIDCLQPYYFHVHLCGSEGSVRDNQFHSNKLKLDKTGWSDLSMKMLDSGDVADHPYQTQFEAFFEALGRDEEMPLTSLKNALRSHEVIFAADRSAAGGGVAVKV
ncbi:MAG: Gfo/Idh/MocA family oxidoreductase [Verrucomicrobiales bacterium]|nr:Gfo/Idh/MocA family oxidoreductase [Verrucomicrobiales bacterium]